MKLLIIGPRYDSLDKARNFSSVWSFYLTREFERMGIKLRFDAPLHRSSAEKSSANAHYSSIDLSDIDHVLALGTRYFTRVPGAKALKNRCRGLVAQIYDRPLPIFPSIDVNFCVIGEGADGKWNVPVGWAADPNIIQPAQSPSELRVLIDHPNYGSGDRSDLTAQVGSEVAKLVRSDLWRGRWKAIRVRQLVDGGISDVPPLALSYGRQSVGFSEVAREYSQTHLFLVTHPESVGLTVLETALAGALPIVPTDFISKDRLATVRSLSWRKSIPWRTVLQSIDIASSREVARKNDWQSIASRIVRRLEEGK